MGSNVLEAEGEVMNNGTFLYFGFGSNMWSKRIHENNPSARFKAVGLLKDFTLEFGHMTRRWKGAAANILPQPGSHVIGILWEISLKDLPNLDRQEGVHDNVYRRTELVVEIMENEDQDGTGAEREKVPCFAYRLNDETREKSRTLHGSKLIPSRRYKNVIITGAKEHKVPQEYITFLENIPDNGYDGDVEVNIPVPDRSESASASSS